MTNAEDVFEITMALMDELGQNGRADSSDNKEYRDRCLCILNALSGELYPYSGTFPEKRIQGRPEAPLIKSFESAIDLDDYICRSLLPYGLAAQLLMGEDPEGAAFCLSRYESMKRGLSRGMPAGSCGIEDVYGGIGFGEFSRW